MSVADKPIALYVHWPWCVRKCPYCDFNSHAIGAGVDEAGYIQALLQDVDAAVELAVADRFQVFFRRRNAEFDVGAGV